MPVVGAGMGCATAYALVGPDDTGGGVTNPPVLVGGVAKFNGSAPCCCGCCCCCCGTGAKGSCPERNGLDANPPVSSVEEFIILNVTLLCCTSGGPARPQ